MDCVSGIFIPVAIIGLLRLCAAPWVTDDCSFLTPEDLTNKNVLLPLGSSQYAQWSVDSLIDDRRSFNEQRSSKEGAGGRRTWASRLFQTFYLGPMLGCFVADFIFLTPWMGEFGWIGIWSVTFCTMGLYHMARLVPMLVISMYYFARGPLAPKIITCISATWYKLYCGLITLFTILLITLACIETNETVCGTYSEIGDTCATGNLRVLHVKSGSNGLFTIAGSNITKDGFELIEFTGFCLGVPAQTRLGQHTWGT